MALKMSKKKAVKKPRIAKKIVQPRVSALQSQTKPTLPTGEYIGAVGRRKVATARVRIYPKTKGEFYINGKLASDYFSGLKNGLTLLTRPLVKVDMNKQFAISAQVSGSGIRAQLEAIVHALSRALVKFNPELRTLLKQEGLLTRDDRMKETRKIGRGGKARRKRQSPKR